MQRLQAFPEILWSAMASSYFYVVGAWCAWWLGTTLGMAWVFKSINLSWLQFLYTGFVPLIFLPFIRPVLGILLCVGLASFFVSGFYKDELKWRVGILAIIASIGFWFAYLFYSSFSQG